MQAKIITKTFLKFLEMLVEAKQKSNYQISL